MIAWGIGLFSYDELGEPGHIDIDWFRYAHE
jgi:hypothetical protein